MTNISISFKRLTIFSIIIISIFVYLVAAYFAFKDRLLQRPTYTSSYYNTISLLNHKFPGRGISDYPNNPVADIPKSYAMILSAEVNRLYNFETQVRPELINICGRWLIEHTDADSDGIIGWGLPFSWDAYGDGSINPDNTEYTITTGIVINALIDWMEKDFYAPQSQIIDIITKAIKPYLDSRYHSSSGLLSYSFEKSDKSYDCFNPAAYLAGQIQRFSHYIEDQELSNKLKRIADQVMLVLTKYKKIDSYGGWYWNYSLQEPTTPNDLAHAVYIIEGIRNYIDFGGTYSNHFDWEAIYLHVDSFCGKNYNEWYAWPKFNNNHKRIPPRLYGLGMVLYLVSRNDPTRTRAESLIRLAKQYKLANGRYAKWPKIKPYHNVIRPAIQEYEAYYIYGLSKFLFPEKASNLFARQIQKSDENKYTTVPLTFFDTQRHKIDLVFNQGKFKGKIIVDNFKNFGLPPRTLPLKILEWKIDRFLLFTRQLWSGRIQCYLLNKNTGIWNEIRLPERLHEFLFRQAVVFNDRVIFILYNSILNSNFLFCLLPSSDNKILVFDDTFSEKINFDIKFGYEHQPHILNGMHKNRLYLACGPSIYALSFDSSNQNAIKVEIFMKKNGWRLIEFLANEKGVIGLYQISKDQNLFCVYDFVKKKIVANFTDEKIPYNLRFENNKASVSIVIGPSDLENIFLIDMRNSAASGLMSVGINNYEGEVIWSQSYYLGGFIDYLSENKFGGDRGALVRLKRLINSRLNFEMTLIDNLIADGPGLKCKVFSINRKPSIFAVQSGKLILLFKRYKNDIKNQIILNSFHKLYENTIYLDNHIENLVMSLSDDPWLKSKRYYLKWPKGVPFLYDGVGIPFNHQNCWAAAILYRAKQYPMEARIRLAAKDIVELFLELEGFRDDPPKHSLKFVDSPKYFKWRYWWGQAKEGWEKEDNISVNSPSWSGDGENIAIPRYRTFDAIAVLCAGLIYPDVIESSLIEYFTRAVEEDRLELFLIPYLAYYNKNPKISRKITVKYLRIDSQPDFRNAMIAYKKLFYVLGKH